MEKQEYDRAYAHKALLLFSGFVVIVMYIETMLVPSLPSIAKQFNVSPAEVSLVLAIYLVTGAALTPIAGKLGDIYGKKKILKIVMPIYAIAVAVTGFSPSFWFLIASRAIQGIGMTIMPLAMSLVREQFPREEIPKAQGILSAMFGVGGAIGLPIGAFVSNTFGWQVTYHSALPFVVLLVALILIFIRESEFTRPGIKINYYSAVALAVALGAIVFTLSEGSTFGWMSTPVLILAVLAISATVFLIFSEKSHDREPVIDWPMLRERNVLVSNLIVLIVGLGFFMAYQTYAYAFENPAPNGFGFGIFDTGLAMVPFSVMSLIVAPLASKYITRTGTKPIIYAGAIVSIAGMAISILATTPDVLTAGAAVIGAGLSALNVGVINLLIFSIHRRVMGIGTATNSVFRIFGSSVGAPIAGLFITELGDKVAFVYSFGFALVAYVLILVIALFAHEVLGKNPKFKLD